MVIVKSQEKPLTKLPSLSILTQKEGVKLPKKGMFSG
jgi:hypothetical protein